MAEENAVDTQVEEQGQEVVTEQVDTEVEQTSGGDVAVEGATDEQANIEKAKEKTPVWFQKKIDKMTWEIRERDRRLDNLERSHNEALNKQAQDISQATQIEKPNIDNFETTEEFNEALFDYKIEQNNAAQERKNIANFERSEQNKKNGDFEQKRSSVMNKGFDKYDNFNNIVGDMPASIMTETVAEALVETSNGEDVLYFLGTNMNEAQKISEMSPVQVAIKLGEISTKLKNKPLIKNSSSAEPIKPVTGSKVVIEKDSSEMTDKEYTAWRRKRIKNRRR